MLSPGENVAITIPARGYINIVLLTNTEITVFLSHSYAVSLYMQTQTFD